MRLRKPLTLTAACISVAAVTLSSGSSWASDFRTSAYQDMHKRYHVSQASLVYGANGTVLGLAEGWDRKRVSLPALPSARADLEYREDALSRRGADYLRVLFGLDLTTAAGEAKAEAWLEKMQAALSLLTAKQRRSNPDLDQLDKMLSTLKYREIGNPTHLVTRRLSSPDFYRHYIRELVFAAVFTAPTAVLTFYLNGFATDQAVTRNALTIGAVFLGAAVIAEHTARAERRAEEREAALEARIATLEGLLAGAQSNYTAFRAETESRIGNLEATNQQILDDYRTVVARIAVLENPVPLPVPPRAAIDLPLFPEGGSRL